MNRKKKHRKRWLGVFIAVFGVGLSLFGIRQAFAASESEFFHDPGGEYVSTVEPEKSEAVTVKLRTDMTDYNSVKVEYALASANTTWKSVSMKKITDNDGKDATGHYYLWEGTIPGQTETYYYRFAVKEKSYSTTTYYYAANGQSSAGYITGEAPAYTNCFQVIPGYSTPEWAKGAYWYFINPDGFYNGNVHNDASDTDTQKAIVWGSNTGGLMDRYGGDLEGVTEKISYLQKLGVEGVYLTPIWESRQNLGYAPLSYDKISPNLGNDSDLLTLTDTLHQNQMYLALDAVFSYAMRDSAWFDYYGEYPLDGAYEGNTTYQNLFTKAQEGEYQIGGYLCSQSWGLNPQMNLLGDTAKNLLYKNDDSVIKRYLSAPYNIDAWRFDAVSSYVSGDKDNGYTQTNQVAQEIREEVAKVESTTKQDALLICEDNVYEMLAGSWDTSYGQRGYLRGWFEETYSQEKFAELLQDYLKQPRATALCTLNLYDLHDAARITNDTKADAAKLRALNIFQMTFLGAPCTYYGDEVGVENEEDEGFGAQNYNSFNWNEEDWNMSIYCLQCALGQLRKEYTALKTGAVSWEVISETEKLMSFGRFDAEGTVISLTNQTDTTYTKTIDVSQYNVKDGATLTDYITGKTYTVANGSVTVEILAGGNVLVTGSKSAEYSKADIYDWSASETKKVYATDFTDGSMGTFVQSGTATVVNGVFQIAKADETVTLLSTLPQSDYTLKTRLSAVEGNDSMPTGLVAYEDGNNMVLAGRMKENGTSYLLLAELVDGTLVTCAKVQEDRPNDDVILQLQKSGKEYSAVYSYDGLCWSVIGKDISCNYSSLKTGLYVAKGAAVSVDYLSFGDYITDRTTVCTPCYPETTSCEFDSNYDNVSRKQVSIWPESLKSEFTYVNGGIERTTGTGIAQLAIRNRMFGDVRVQATLKPNAGSKAGITMLRSSVDGTIGQGYAISLSADGTITLTCAGTVLGTKSVEIPEDGLAVIAEHVGSRLWIYTDKTERELLFSVDNVTETKGYVTYFLDGTGKICNDTVHTLTQNWTDVLGAYTPGFAKNNTGIKATTGAQAFAYISGVGYTDVVFGGNITLEQADTSVTEYSAGIVIGAKQRTIVEQSDGLTVTLHEDGHIRLSRNGTVLAVTEKSYGTSAHIRVIQKDNHLYTYINGAYCGALSCTLDAYNGGVAGLVSVNSTTTFGSLQILDITNEELAPSVGEKDTIFSDTMTFKNGTYDAENNIYTVDGMTAYADFHTNLTGDDQTMFFHIKTEGDSFDVRYRSGENGILALRITEREVVAVLEGQKVSNAVPCSLDFSKQNNVILRSDNEGVRLWLNGVEVETLIYDIALFTASDYSTPYCGVYLPVAVDEEAEVRNMAVWEETSERAGYPVVNREDIIGSLSHKNTQADKNSILLSDTTQMLLFETTLNQEDYYMSFDVDINAEMLDILCRSDGQQYAVLRLEDGRVCAVTDSTLTTSQTVEGLVLSQVKKVTLKAAKDGITLWLNDVPIGLPAEFFDTNVLTTCVPGIHAELNQGMYVNVKDMTIWTSQTKTEPVYVSSESTLYGRSLELALGGTNEAKMMFTTGLASKEDYYYSFQIADLTETCFNIPVLSDGTNDLTLKVFSNQYVLVSNEKAVSNWIYFSLQGLDNLDLTVANKVVLHINAGGGIEIWLNGHKLQTPTYLETFTAVNFKTMAPGIYAGGTSTISDVYIWRVEEQSAPTYQLETHKVIAARDEMSLSDIGTSTKTVAMSGISSTEKNFMMSFEVTTDANYYQVNLMKNSTKTIALRIYPTQCVLVENGAAVSIWTQFGVGSTNSTLAYLKDGWSETRMYCTVCVHDATLSVWINGQKISGLTLNSGYSLSDYSDICGSFSAYQGTYADFDNVVLWTNK